MGLFKKKGDVIDLVKLSEKGVLQRSRAIASRREGVNLNGGEVLDLTHSSSASSNSGGSGVGSEGGGDDFLSSLAGFGAGNSGSVGIGNSNLGVSSTSGGVRESLRAARYSKSGDVNALKIKLEDMNYKFERLLERLEKIERRIG